MNTKKPSGNKASVLLIAVLAAAGVIGGILFWKKEKPPDTVEPAAAVTSELTAPAVQPEDQEASAVINYQKIETDQDLRTLMEQRKSEYGIGKSVDMILTPDETLTIGEVTVPMREILDKIRLKKGQVIETDISDSPFLKTPPVDKERFRLEYMKKDNRAAELVKLLIHPDIVKDESAFPKHAREYAETLNKLKDFKEYQEIQTDIEAFNHLLKLSDADLKKKILDDMNVSHLENDRLRTQIKAKSDITDDSEVIEEVRKTEARCLELEKFIMNPDNIKLPEYSRYVGEHAELKEIRALAETYAETAQTLEELREMADRDAPEIRKILLEKINHLAHKKEQLEPVIALHLIAGKKVEVYGIYVVQSRDNIWNIHFNFLKEYFQSKKITVSPKADEPDERGQSSGIGKILKFSETMVSIYNVKDTVLSYDLDLIRPLNKIVIFNMGQALALLEQIDYANIRQIRFDGERLWLPAEG